MKNPLTKTIWSPYVVGTLIGILSCFTFIFVDQALGVSRAFVHLFGFLAGLISVDHVVKTPYLSGYVEAKPVFDWQFLMVVGIFIGAFIASRFSKITYSAIPYLWGERFGFSANKRRYACILAGFLMLFGARLAGGCTLGHGVSGCLQLATSSWLFLIVLFMSGILTAFFLYKR
jgi:uncharacterized protein